MENEKGLEKYTPFVKGRFNKANRNTLSSISTKIVNNLNNAADNNKKNATPSSDKRKSDSFGINRNRLIANRKQEINIPPPPPSSMPPPPPSPKPKTESSNNFNETILSPRFEISKEKEKACSSEYLLIPSNNSDSSSSLLNIDEAVTEIVNRYNSKNPNLRLGFRCMSELAIRKKIYKWIEKSEHKDFLLHFLYNFVTSKYFVLPVDPVNIDKYFTKSIPKYNQEEFVVAILLTDNSRVFQIKWCSYQSTQRVCSSCCAIMEKNSLTINNSLLKQMMDYIPLNDALGEILSITNFLNQFF